MHAFLYGVAHKFRCVAQYCHDIVLIYYAPEKGISAEVIRVDVPESFAGRARGHTVFTPLRRIPTMANPTDPFSASIIPFEVPEQMRAFAEKGVSQARDSYAKFKDVAESHNSIASEGDLTPISCWARSSVAVLLAFIISISLAE